MTITDVAQHVGVSTSAVSKVLRNAYGVSPEMRDRVRAAMAELGYRPHAAARGMRGRTYTIGVLMDGIRNAFFADLLDGMNGVLGDTEYAMLIGYSGAGPEEQYKATFAMVDRQVDGLILIAPTFGRQEVEKTATAVPTVVIGHHDASPHYDLVVNDDAAGAREVVDHLVGLGHRRIGLISSPPVEGSGWTRPPAVVASEGYREAMAAHGLADPLRIVPAAFTDEGGYRGAVKLLSASEPPTAIFAGADVAATGVFRAAAELGLRIPEELSLAGYNNTAVAALEPVQLTSVDQAGGDMGAMAARLLLERIEDRRTRSLTRSVTPSLVIRRTTAPPPRG
ncbi:LacI family transcriptional regulator [Streptomyces sp. A7024]|uniref:LacI family transcriptional regulator n=1 Tax=Streptomyces coryli TaxID=1128680 RepID=A0A6G4TXV5_9ACTN|nr:LacI family transcriptional regulator [Streptomyces coryli]